MWMSILKRCLLCCIIIAFGCFLFGCASADDTEHAEAEDASVGDFEEVFEESGDIYEEISGEDSEEGDESFEEDFEEFDEIFSEEAKLAEGIRLAEYYEAQGDMLSAALWYRFSGDSKAYDILGALLQDYVMQFPDNLAYVPLCANYSHSYFWGDHDYSRAYWNDEGRAKAFFTYSEAVNGVMQCEGLKETFVNINTGMLSDWVFERVFVSEDWLMDDDRQDIDDEMTRLASEFDEIINSVEFIEPLNVKTGIYLDGWYNHYAEFPLDGKYSSVSLRFDTEERDTNDSLYVTADGKRIYPVEQEDNVYVFDTNGVKKLRVASRRPGIAWTPYSERIFVYDIRFYA